MSHIVLVFHECPAVVVAASFSAATLQFVPLSAQVAEAELAPAAAHTITVRTTAAGLGTGPASL